VNRVENVTMDVLVLCYRKGCGEKFNPLDNKEGCCRHHPGVPIFHDALKGWSCCSRRSTDFTEFLNIPGCSYGQHSNEKPPEPEKKTTTDPIIEDVPIVVHTEPERKPIPAPMQRPSADEPMKRLEMNVGESLKTALANQLKQLTVNDSSSTADAAEIAKGASCKNNGCLAVYESEDSNRDICCYHTGIPVFHEGMKYWSCCQRKTSDFNAFLSQEGCATGCHLWKKKSDVREKKVACRFDWHQTPSSVTISVYAKITDPTKTWVDVNQVSANLHIVFDGINQFDKSFVLRGVIDPSRSSVSLLGTKVEVTLKKAEAGSWSSLEMPATAANGDS
jgi:cysteine/histidine-rich domain-containing protein 1